VCEAVMESLRNHNQGVEVVCNSLWCVIAFHDTDPPSFKLLVATDLSEVLCDCMHHHLGSATVMEACCDVMLCLLDDSHPSGTTASTAKEAPLRQHERLLHHGALQYLLKAIPTADLRSAELTRKLCVALGALVEVEGDMVQLRDRLLESRVFSVLVKAFVRYFNHVTRDGVLHSSLLSVSSCSALRVMLELMHSLLVNEVADTVPSASSDHDNPDGGPPLVPCLISVTDLQVTSGGDKESERTLELGKLVTSAENILYYIYGS